MDEKPNFRDVVNKTFKFGEFLSSIEEDIKTEPLSIKDINLTPPAYEDTIYKKQADDIKSGIEPKLEDIKSNTAKQIESIKESTDKQVEVIIKSSKSSKRLSIFAIIISATSLLLAFSQTDFFTNIINIFN